MTLYLEIGHVTMRHTAENLSQTKIFLPITGLLFMLGIDPMISTTLSTYLYSLPHSRALETEGKRSLRLDVVAFHVAHSGHRGTQTYVPRMLRSRRRTPVSTVVLLFPTDLLPECSQISRSSTTGVRPSSSVRTRRRRSGLRSVTVMLMTTLLTPRSI